MTDADPTQQFNGEDFIAGLRQVRQFFEILVKVCQPEGSEDHFELVDGVRLEVTFTEPQDPDWYDDFGNSVEGDSISKITADIVKIYWPGFDSSSISEVYLSLYCTLPDERWTQVVVPIDKIQAMAFAQQAD